MNRIRTFISTHPRTIWGSGLALVLFVMLVYTGISNSHKPIVTAEQTPHAFGAQYDDAEKQMAIANRNSMGPALRDMIADYNRQVAAAKAEARAATKQVNERVNGVDLRLKKVEVPFDFQKYEDQLKPLMLDVIRKEGVPVSSFDALKHEVAAVRANFPRSSAA